MPIEAEMAQTHLLERTVKTPLEDFPLKQAVMLAVKLTEKKNLVCEMALGCGRVSWRLVVCGAMPRLVVSMKSV